jgi:peptide/nickel transport system substrate-binding protein
MRRTRTTTRSGSHRALLVTAAALLAIGATATTASATTVPAGDPDAAVVAGFVIEPTNLDIINQAGIALDQLLLGNVYETLVTSTPDGEITPGLAELEISEDRLTYTATR